MLRRAEEIETVFEELDCEMTLTDTHFEGRSRPARQVSFTLHLKGHERRASLHGVVLSFHPEFVAQDVGMWEAPLSFNETQEAFEALCLQGLALWTLFP